MHSRIRIQLFHFMLWSILMSGVKKQKQELLHPRALSTGTTRILNRSSCVSVHSWWGDPLWIQPAFLQSRGPGSPGERAQRRHPFPAGGAQRLPATASPWIPRQPHDGLAAQPGTVPGGRPLSRCDAHGNQNHRHAHQFRGEKTSSYDPYRLVKCNLSLPTSSLPQEDDPCENPSDGEPSIITLHVDSLIVRRKDDGSFSVGGSCSTLPNNLKRQLTKAHLGKTLLPCSLHSGRRHRRQAQESTGRRLSESSSWGCEQRLQDIEGDTDSNAAEQPQSNSQGKGQHDDDVK